MSTEPDPLAQPAPDVSLNFEEALRQIEEIVHELEEGEVGLEQSLARFEEGIGLLRRCYRFLEAVEQKVELLTGLDADDRPVTTPFATADETEAAASASAKPGRRRAPARKSPPPPPEAPTPDAPPASSEQGNFGF